MLFSVIFFHNICIQECIIAMNRTNSMVSDGLHSVTFSVTDIRGKKLAGVRIFIHNDQDITIAGEKTNEDGMAKINLSDGDYTYVVYCNNYLSQLGKFSMSDHENKNIAISFSGYHTITFDFENLDYYNDYNAQIIIKHEQLKGDMSQTRAEVQENQATVYLPNGVYPYELYFYKNRWDGKFVEYLDTIKVAGTDYTKNVSMNNFREITFHVTDRIGNLDSMDVFIDFKDQRIAQLETNSDGNTSLRLPGGKYVYGVFGRGYQAVIDTFIVSHEPLDKMISYTDCHMISFIVTNMSKKDWPEGAHVNIDIFDKNNEQITIGHWTDDTGKCSICLLEGTYYYLAKQDYFHLSSKEMFHVGKKDETLRIVLKKND